MLSLLVPSCLLFFSERGALAPSWRSCACLLLSCQPHTRPCPFYLFFSSLATSPLQKNDVHPATARVYQKPTLLCYTCSCMQNIQSHIRGRDRYYGRRYGRRYGKRKMAGGRTSADWHIHQHPAA